MEIAIIILLLILGFVLGFFINLFLYKISNKSKFRHLLKYCDYKILYSRYFLVEIVTSIAIIILYTAISPKNFYEWIVYFGYALFVLLLIGIFIYDYKYYLIPNEIVYPGIILALLFSLINFSISFWHSLSGAFMSSIFFLFFVLISKEKWMGWGDVKLGFFIGALIGWPHIIFGILISFIIGGIIGLILLILKKKNIKSEVPLGTFLTLGTLITILWGDYIIDKYINILVY